MKNVIYYFHFDGNYYAGDHIDIHDNTSVNFYQGEHTKETSTQKAAYEAEYKAQNKYKSLRGFVIAKEYAKL